MFKGSFVAIVTPFMNGAVDFAKLEELVEYQLANGTSGILSCGTTGESATLTYEEHKKVNKTVIDLLKGRAQSIAGAGSNNTRESIELAQDAAAAGADAILCITPYYNKPTPEGQYRHFKAISESVNVPIILYNVPSRTGTNMEVDTVKRLSHIKNIVAIKEASGKMDQITRIIQETDLDVLSGDDSLTLPLMALGAAGVISVVANIVPDMTAKLCDAMLKGDMALARKINNSLFYLSKAMFIETNPLPVKTALAFMGKINSEFRLPLVNMRAENEKKLKQILKDYNLIK